MQSSQLRAGQRLNAGPAAALRASRRVVAPRCQAASTSTVSATVQALKGWAQAKGVDLKKVEFSVDLQTEQLVLVAAADITAGEALLTVPDSAWMSAETLKTTKIGKALAGQEPWVQMALQLMADRWGPSGQGSEWAPYASSLPARSGSPLTWTPEQQAALRGTQVAGMLQSYTSFFQSTWQSLRSGPLAQQPGLLPAACADSFDAFLWAVASVRARAHAPLGEGASLALVPLADLVTHRRAANTKWSAKGAGALGGLFGGKAQVLVLEAGKAIRKGETLSLDYAPDKLDGSVLLDAGVVDGSNPREGYSLTLTLSPSDRFYDDKADILEGAEMPASKTWTLSATGDGTPPEDMLAFLRLQHLAVADAFLLESIFRSDVWGFMLEPVSEGNEATVCREMAAGARAALAAYPTPLAEGEALLSAHDSTLRDLTTSTSGGSGSGGMSAEALSALRVAVGEQRALANTAAWFEERLVRQLKTLQYYQERRLRRLGLVDDEGRTTYDSFFKDGIA